MIALQGNVFLVIRRILASFLVLYPVKGFGKFQTILILAGNPARMASNALGRVYRNSESWHFQLPSR
jgi:hypothetical protein